MQQSSQACHNALGRQYSSHSSPLLSGGGWPLARYSVQKEGSEAPLKEDGAPGRQVGEDCLASSCPVCLARARALAKQILYFENEH